ERAVREQAEASLARALKGHPARATVVSLLLGIVRRCVRHRERSRYCRSELFAVCRGAFLSIGERLARDGILESDDSGFDLSQEEIFGLVQGTAVAHDWQRLVELRRSERARAELTAPSSHVVTHGAVAARSWEGVAASTGDDPLHGLGSSAGIARGRARVL